MKHLLLPMLVLSLLSCGFVKPLPSVTVPDDYPTIQEAIDALPSGGTVKVKAGTYTGNYQYGTNADGTPRTSSFYIGGNRNITIKGEPGAILTYDPAAPPQVFGVTGILFWVNNQGMTTIDGLHFIGTMELGDPPYPYDYDVCLYFVEESSFTVRNSEFEKCGHAGIKHGSPNKSTPFVMIENNRFHDNGFTTRDHHTYFPGGAQYIIRYNTGWDGSGYCVGFGNQRYTVGAQIYNNTCLNGYAGIVSGWGQGAIVRNNTMIGNSVGMWLEASGTYTNNTIVQNGMDIYSERACGAVVTNWCAVPRPLKFYDNGNLYEYISHPERVQ